MNQTQTRKRPAPGTSPPTSNSQQSSYPNYGVADPSQLSNDQFLSWGGDDNNYQSGQAPQNFPMADSFGQYQPANQQLVRRNLNQQLTTRSGYQGGQQPGNDPWGDQDIAVAPALDVGEEDDAELDAKAAAAKRDALSKRVPKQIPPFIQKLSSFLERDYTDLIRWSDDGSSFIVVDEDKFAQKLIPELFKHNNYASFVRQLNMYGFHKVVGLSDNSMRASEKKAKTPREYKHPYFKRGRPDLLWLIEKPKTTTKSSSTKKPQKGEQHENADDDIDEMADGQPEDSKPTQQNTDLTTLPKADLASLTTLKKEVENLQKSQQQIFSILGRMRDENNQYIRQASAMVANHERHESSINAILTFLATFYNQTLQDREGTGNMFAHAIPNNQPQGSVVDVGDYPDAAYSSTGQFQPMPRRPLALLPPPAADSPTTEPSPSPTRPRTRSTTQKPSGFGQQSNIRPGSAGGMGSPPQSQGQPGTRNSPRLAKDNNEILNVINQSNAQTPQNPGQGPKLDFNTALQHYQNSNGKAPLTPEQRNTMLNIMANNSGTANPAAITDSESNPQPYLDYFNSNHEQLEMLHRLQQEQDSKVQDLAGRLQPLSPSGSIPGLDISPTTSNQYNPNADGTYNDNFDINNFIDNDIFDPSNNNLDPNFDWGNLDGDLTNPQVKTEASETPRNEQNSNDNGSLFGEEDDDDDDDEGDDDDDNGSQEFKGGRVVGSVDTSSGHPSPSVEDANDNDADDNTAAAARNPRKKRRTAK